MFRTVPSMVIALALAGCGLGPSEPQVTVENATVTLPAVPGRPGAAYFTLETNVDPTRLLGISSPRIGRIELHESVTVGGFTRMIRLENANFSSARPLNFEPGGRHAMLFDVDPALRPGDRVPLAFSFDQVPTVTIDAEVRAAGDAGHGKH